MTESPPKTYLGMFRALRHRNFRLFASGQMISLIGTWMQTVAQSWLVYRLTGSAMQLGMVGFASQIPIFLVVPLGGLAADRFDRRSILFKTQTAAMLLAGMLAALTLTEQIQIWHLYVLAVLLGVANAFDIPTRQAFTVQMVGREDLPNAISLNSSMVNGARMVGPALAGILVGWVGEGWCFLGNSLSYLAVLAGLAAMRLPPWRPTPQQGNAIQNLREGFTFVLKSHPIRDLLAMLGLVSLMASPHVVLMPIFAEEILGGGAHALGLMLGMSGAGAVVGALILASRRALAGSGIWIAVSGATLGLGTTAFALSRSLELSCLLMLPIGFSMMTQMALSNTLVQAMVPDYLRGRVMSFHSMMFMGMAPLGALLSGSLAPILGAPGTVILGGVLLLAGSAVFSRRLPRFRAAARRMTREARIGDSA
jgi:MFS family permease